MHIDNYVVMNLAGFFYLAQDFGGIEVCVTPTTVNGTADANLYDLGQINSGWDAVADGYNLKKGGSQYLHLAADQALAFVRDRDSLPDTDLSRTHRQQAVIDYVIWQLKHENAFSDLGQLDALLGDAKQWLVVNNGFNLFDFATNMSALNGSNLKFYTLPIAGYADIELNGSMQDVNDIDVGYIQQVVNKAFNPPPPVDAVGRRARRRRRRRRSRPRRRSRSTSTTAGPPRAWPAASPRRWSPSATRPAPSPTRRRSRRPSATGTEVFYGAGASANAAKIATDFGATAKALASLPAAARGGAARHRVDRGAGRPHPDVIVGVVDTVDPVPVLLVGGQQRRGRRRGHRRRQRQVRNTLRVLMATVCSLYAGRNGDARRRVSDG